MKTSVNIFRKKGISFNFIKYSQFKKSAVCVVRKVLENENIEFTDINFYFCDSKYIRELNRKYLNHDFETDILTFNYLESGEADVVISFEQIAGNARDYRVDLLNEAFRVVIHGTLHLCGYKDGNKSEKIRMRKRENYYMKNIVNKC